MYAFLLIWPKERTEITLGAPLSSSNTVVTLLGSGGDPLSWRVANGTRGIVIDVSKVQLHLLRSEWTWAFKLENLLFDDNVNTTITRTSTTGRGVPVSFHSSLLFSVLLYLFYVRM